MNKATATIFLAVSAPTLFAATIIPAPATLEPRTGVFTLGPKTRIVADAASRTAAQHLAELTGCQIAASGEIELTTRDAKTGLGPEGYELTVSADRIVIRAPQPAGVFYGVQTLRQLLPGPIPCVRIEDQPRFPWRGLMLDASRHFFNKAEVKRLLDAMALHKLNTFHWHLTDDAGWRIEIKKHPKLTTVGAWRKDIGFGLDPKSATAYSPDGQYGGFYTQDDIREIVAYAAARHITIVPEIEMPGHSTATLVAYPELGCTGGPYHIQLAGGVMHGIYCAGKDATFTFLQDVLGEVFELFPGRYVHIGGDEVPKDNWKKCPRCQSRIQAESLSGEHELQSYFIQRIEKFVNAHNRTLMGWSEIREGGLAPRAALMDWIGGAVEGATGGHDVVMSPTSHCYFDYYQTHNRSGEPRAIGGYLPLSKVYTFEPVPAKLAPQFHKHILGAQGNVWTEYIPSLQQVEYMAFPRLCALAEVTWSPATARNWEDFTARLKTHFLRLDALGIAYHPLDNSILIGEWRPANLNKTSPVTLDWGITANLNAPGTWRVAPSYTKGKHGVDIAWIAIFADGKEIARDTHAGFAGVHPRNAIYTLNIPTLQPGARYTIKAQLTGNGGADSHGVVTMSPARRTP